MDVEGPRYKPLNPFRWFDSSPEVIRSMVMTYVRYPVSFRNSEAPLHVRGTDICHGDGAGLVDAVRADVCSREPPQAG